MSLHPTTRPVPPRPAPESDSRDLTVNKVLAGAGAAATSAVLGSFFGAAGTVAGAALGSVASTVATTIYQRYLDRTRDTLAARIRPMRAGARPPGAPVPRVASEDPTVRLRAAARLPRRRWPVWAGATVLVFLVGLLTVTGIEWVKGSTLTGGDPGTSVGRAFGQGHAAPATEPATAPDPTTDPPVVSVPGPGPVVSVPGPGPDGAGPDDQGSGGPDGTGTVPLLPGLLGG